MWAVRESVVWAAGVGGGREESVCGRRRWRGRRGIGGNPPPFPAFPTALALSFPLTTLALLRRDRAASTALSTAAPAALPATLLRRDTTTTTTLATTAFATPLPHIDGFTTTVVLLECDGPKPQSQRARTHPPPPAAGAEADGQSSPHIQRPRYQ